MHPVSVSKSGQRPRRGPRAQSGIMLLEALVGILIFSVGILALVGMQASMIRATTDVRNRSEASFLANQIIGRMWLDRTNLATYAHRPTGGGTTCDPTGADSTNATVTAWLASFTTAGQSTYLPGATTAKQQIIVNTASNNLVTVRICWQSPTDASPRNVVATANIN